MIIASLIEQQAFLYGERTFIFHDDKKISYFECNQQASRIAANLSSCGVAPGDTIIILMDNCLEFIYCFLGFGRIGAVMVPVNPTLKPEELVYIINHSAAETMIIAPEILPVLPRLKSLLPNVKRVFVTEGKIAEGAESFEKLLEPVEIPPICADEDSNASIVYTSGTTGTPKGVILSHRNYIWNTRGMIHSNPVTDTDRFLLVLPLFHVNGQVVSVLTPLMIGGEVVLINGRFNPFSILPLIEKYRITIMSAVPTIYGIMCKMHNTHSHDVGSIKFFVTGGAPMPEEIYRLTVQKFNKPLIMGYGLTEGTCASAVADSTEPIRWNSTGPALRHINIRLVDESMNDVPVGEIGEILISGPTVMKGYYKNPEATTDVLKNGWLKTGDLGRFDQDGYLYVVDRVKDMIIRGGLNIYPVQLEQVIQRMPKVEEVAVIGIDDPNWGQEVLAVIKRKLDTELYEIDVINYCKQYLALYKCPRFIRFVEEFPKTATGKIRKIDLKKQFHDVS
jgi:long-chain acyl-CoA synthetase